MKRNLDLMRQLLISIETQDTIFLRDFSKITVDNFTAAEINYHLLLLLDANYIDGEIKPRQRHVDVAYVKRLTMQGHDYLDAIRNDTVWTSTKEKIAKLGDSVTLDIVKEVAVASLKAML